MSKQVTEDYVSFETAKLLKEKKFSWKCNTAYLEFEDGRVELRYEDKAFYQEQTKRRYCVPALLAPSLYNAMKWLREVHNIHISINVGCDVDNKNYIFYIPTIVKLNNKSVEYIDPFCEDEDEFDSNEEAVEAALKYTLENLI